jgi:restriction system protein
LSMLKAAGFVDSPARGIWRITERGRALLRQYPDGFDDDTGRRLLRESKPSTPAGPDLDSSGALNVDLGQLTPDERIDAAVQELCSTVAAELLDQILKASASRTGLFGCRKSTATILIWSEAG